MHFGYGSNYKSMELDLHKKKEYGIGLRRYNPWCGMAWHLIKELIHMEGLAKVIG